MRLSDLLYPVLMACCASQVHAITLTVDTTSDASLTVCTLAPADCSLRGAMTVANGNGVADTIAFGIPLSDPGCVAGTNVCTLQPLTSLPTNSDDGLVVDGYTQPGAVANTLSPDQGGTNAQLKIVLSGASCAVCGRGFLGGAGTLRGLVINGFPIGVNFFGSGGVVEGCFIGTDASGTSAVRNGRGIYFEGNAFGGFTSSNGRIGGLLPMQRNLISGNSPFSSGQGEGIALEGINHSVLGNLIGTNAAGTARLGNTLGILLGGGVNFSQFVGNTSADGRNLISGNNGAGIQILGAGGSGQPTFGTRIRGNFIGTDVSGTLALGNSSFGIQISAGANGAPVVGGTAPGDGNLIAFNGAEGVATQFFTRGSVLGNRMFANARLGIGTGGARRANDPGDPDGGFNNSQNFPEISAFSTNGSSFNLSYRVDSTTADSTYPLRVELFKADGDEGRDLLAADSYLSAEAQTVKALISVVVPGGVALSANDVIVATATDAQGNTSEFSFSPVTLTIETPGPSSCTSADSVFCQGFESGPQASLLVRVRALASSGPFLPNGVVSVSDNRGGTCTLTLSATTTPLTSAGACTLVNSGAPGAISITATLDTLRSAFGSASGGNPSISTGFVIQ